ncbi:hypothetical protein [Halapricum sp. CBA1109]|uniref:hypothetical protein n=1 Tax=Halapricum sp. CBA1109 TaxID=2668068 RepID=UPI001E4A35CD|nr:hypothetical protein [Halapricum sp. CBA1109]
MLRRLRENGPVVLVPLAWTFAIAAHRDLLALRTVLVAHLVMDSIILVFTVLSWRDMDTGILLTWRRVLVAGFVLTVAGTVGLVTDPRPTSSSRGPSPGGWRFPRRDCSTRADASTVSRPSTSSAVS